MFITTIFALALFKGSLSLSSDMSPGAQFELDNWKLTLPDSSEKSPSELEAGYTSNYFYTADDGAMTFYVEGGSGSTQNSKYSRSELRQLCNPSTSGNPDRYNWPAQSGTYTVSGKYKIGDIDSTSRKIVIQQIHAYDGPPLIKMKWEKNKVYALVKTDASGDNEESYLMGDAPQYEQFLLKTTVKSGYLKLYLNNVRIYNIKVKDYWVPYNNYFKAGNYLQSTSSSAFAYVYIYYLNLYHDGSCEYTSDTDAFTNDEDSNSHRKNVNIGIGIAVAIICLYICIFIGYYVYKRKYAEKHVVSFNHGQKTEETKTSDFDGSIEENKTNNTEHGEDVEIEVEVEVR